MAEIPAGTEIAYSVTWLEMTRRPERPSPPAPLVKGLALLRAEDPPLDFFLYLYDAVGAPYEWVDLHKDPARTAAFIADPKVELFVLNIQGAPAGFFVLDFRQDGAADMSYFGLTQRAVGRGVGDWLLHAALQTAWERGVDKVTVNTCTLDHPRALALYQRWGFRPVRREARSRVLTRPRNV
jgi:GNAT superfamily N-acetyltransferase